MNIQNRAPEAYLSNFTPAERSADLRVSPPPRRAENTGNTSSNPAGSLTQDAVELGQFEQLRAMLQRELDDPSAFSTGLPGVATRSLDDIAEEIRTGRYKVDANATAARMSHFEHLLG